MKPFVDAGHVLTISPMGNLPVIKDLVVDMAPFWDKVRAVKPYLDSDRRAAADASSASTPKQEVNRSARRRSASCAAAASRSATRWRPIPTSSARRRSRRPSASSATCATPTTAHRLQDLQRRARDLGLHALLLLQPALPEGRRPARRDREARRRGVPSRASPATRARSTRRSSSSPPTRAATCSETELVPKTIGPIAAITQIPFAPAAGPGRQGAEPAHAAQGARQRRGQAPLEAARGADKARPDDRPLAPPVRHDGAAEHEGPLRVLPRLPRQRSRPEGARHLHPRVVRGSSASSWSTCRRSPAAAPATSTRPSPTTTCTSTPASSARPSARLRHAAHDLQRLHAEPAPGEQEAAGRPRGARAGQRQPRSRSARPRTRAASRCATCCGRSSEGDGYERFKQIAVALARRG